LLNCDQNDAFYTSEKPTKQQAKIAAQIEVYKDHEADFEQMIRMRSLSPHHQKSIISNIESHKSIEKLNKVCLTKLGVIKSYERHINKEKPPKQAQMKKPACNVQLSSLDSRASLHSQNSKNERFSCKN